MLGSMSELIKTAESGPGKVEVARTLDSPPENVWEALTDPGSVIRWFGALSSPLRIGHSTRLDFGDGDFFSLTTLVIKPPYRLQYEWRFLGIGPLDTITWDIIPEKRGCLLRVTDTEPERSREEGRLLRQGWMDFTNRLVKYLRKGKQTRYRWRHEFDASIELGMDRDALWDMLLRPGAQARWLPFALKEASAFTVNDGLEPSALSVRDVELIPPSQVRLEIAHEDWLCTTQCNLLLSPRRQGSLLSVSHNGWEAISLQEDYQKQQRTRFSAVWISALQRARHLIG